MERCQSFISNKLYTFKNLEKDRNNFWNVSRWYLLKMVWRQVYGVDFAFVLKKNRPIRKLEHRPRKILFWFHPMWELACWSFGPPYYICWRHSWISHSSCDLGTVCIGVLERSGLVTCMIHSSFLSLLFLQVAFVVCVSQEKQFPLNKGKNPWMVFVIMLPFHFYFILFFPNSCLKRKMLNARGLVLKLRLYPKKGR